MRGQYWSPQVFSHGGGVHGELTSRMVRFAAAIVAFTRWMKGMSNDLSRAMLKVVMLKSPDCFWYV